MNRSLYDRFRTWQKNLNSSYGDDISTPSARFFARLHTHLVDHAWIRRFWTNMYPLDGDAGQVWRSNQPGPARFRRLEKLGIKSIINLRGPSAFAIYLFEEESCAKAGISLHNCAIPAYTLGSRERYLELLSLYEQAERPLLIHCKSGADRAGIASALYLIHQEGRPVTEAKKQLGLRFGHRKGSKAGALDFLLERYAEDTAREPQTLRTWFETRYDRDALLQKFNEKRGKPKNV